MYATTINKNIKKIEISNSVYESRSHKAASNDRKIRTKNFTESMKHKPLYNFTLTFLSIFWWLDIGIIQHAKSCTNCIFISKPRFMKTA